jgi:hypothetical protein
MKNRQKSRETPLSHFKKQLSAIKFDPELSKKPLKFSDDYKRRLEENRQLLIRIGFFKRYPAA